MRLEHIDLERLSPSAANMRARMTPDISAILPSVRDRGILVPLLVRPNGEPGGYEIVAGRRRYFAAKAVGEERGGADPLPCAIIEAGDDAAALEASLIENVVRLDPDEVTQWEAFSRLVHEGRTAEEIAGTFALTERQVRRILALGNLLPRIRTLYRKELIDAGTVRQLTLATKAQQKDWLALYDSPDAYAPTGRALKEWLFGGQAIPTTAALFELSAYSAPIVSDLFGEESYFADLEAFWTLQRQAIKAKRAELLEAGWSAVELLEPGTYFQSWQFEKRARTKGGRVYIAVSARGEVAIHEGFLPRREARKGERGDATPAPARPEVTSALRTYVDLHRHAAVRAKLIEYPTVAVRLVVAHAIAGSPLWTVRADPQRADRESIAESVKASASEAAFDQDRRAVLELLGFEPDAPTVLGSGRSAGVEAVFGRLLALTDEQVLSVLAIVMGESLEAGSGIVDILGAQIGVDMACAWQPDDAFFELLRSREVLVAMVAEVAGQETASANTNEKGKTLKAIIADCLAGQNGRVKVEGWVPKWLRFPAAAYCTVAAADDTESESQTVS
jgi:ParB family chromosome partitioning protein